MSTETTTRAPGIARQRAVASYPTYREAERAVDHLADSGFPVTRTTIVGRDLQYVELVTGRTTYRDAALHGAVLGSFVGFLIGWLFAAFNWFDPLVATGWLIVDGLWFGLLTGALLGVIGHALQGGRRDFSSVPSVRAERYEVLVDEEHASEAERLLARLNQPAEEPRAKLEAS